MQKPWIVTQLTNCQKLADSLNAFEASKGRYPGNLEELTESDFLSAWAYGRLRFQATPEAVPQEWTYRMPIESGGAFLFSPASIERQTGGKKKYILGFSDRSARIHDRDEMQAER